MAKLTWKGLRQLERAFADLPKDVRVEVNEKGMEILAEKTAFIAKGIVQERSGRLKRSIVASKARAAGKDEAVWVVGSDDPGHGYVGYFLEKGVRSHSVGAGSDLERVTRKGARFAGKQYGASEEQRKAGLKVSMHPGHRPYKFIEPAVRFVSKQAGRILKQKLGETVRTALRRRGAT